MGDEIGFLIVGIIIGLVFGGVFFSIYHHEKTASIGDMVCSERGYGKFISYKNNKIHCNEKPIVEKYDGGYIVVEKKLNI